MQTELNLDQKYYPCVGSLPGQITFNNRNLFFMKVVNNLMIYENWRFPYCALIICLPSFDRQFFTKNPWPTDSKPSHNPLKSPLVLVKIFFNRILTKTPSSITSSFLSAACCLTDFSFIWN